MKLVDETIGTQVKEDRGPEYFRWDVPSMVKSTATVFVAHWAVNRLGGHLSAFGMDINYPTFGEIYNYVGVVTIGVLSPALVPVMRFAEKYHAVREIRRLITRIQDTYQEWRYTTFSRDAASFVFKGQLEDKIVGYDKEIQIITREKRLRGFRHSSFDEGDLYKVPANASFNTVVQKRVKEEYRR